MTFLEATTTTLALAVYVTALLAAAILICGVLIYITNLLCKKVKLFNGMSFWLVYLIIMANSVAVMYLITVIKGL